MTRTELLEILERHRKWLVGEDGGEYASLCGANLRGANLRGADLREADLRGADLCGADLYKCCLPLRCGGTHITLDRLQMAQLIFHVCSMECEDSEVLALQKSLYAFANEFAESRDDLKNKKFPEA